MQSAESVCRCCNCHERPPAATLVDYSSSIRTREATRTYIFQLRPHAPRRVAYGFIGVSEWFVVSPTAGVCDGRNTASYGRRHRCCCCSCSVPPPTRHPCMCVLSITRSVERLHYGRPLGTEHEVRSTSTARSSVAGPPTCNSFHVGVRKVTCLPIGRCYGLARERERALVLPSFPPPRARGAALLRSLFPGTSHARRRGVSPVKSCGPKDQRATCLILFRRTTRRRVARKAVGGRECLLAVTSGHSANTGL